MKVLMALCLSVIFSASAMATPSVLSQLKVCKENQKTPQPLTVTWSQDGQSQTISFQDVESSSTYPVLQTQVSDYGATIVNYYVQGRGQEHVTIFCDAIMTNEDVLMTVSNCGSDY